MNIKCKACNEEVYVNMYFSDADIFKRENEFAPYNKYSEAFCRGEAICPNCGYHINEIFTTEISPSTIIALATKEI